MTRRCIIRAVFFQQDNTHQSTKLASSKSFLEPGSGTFESLEDLGKLTKKVLEFDAGTVGHLYKSFQGRLEKVESNKGAINGYLQLCVTFRIVDFRQNSGFLKTRKVYVTFCYHSVSCRKMLTC